MSTPSLNVLKASVLFLDGLNTVQRLIDFSDFVDYEIMARLPGEDSDVWCLRDECRDRVYREIYQIAEDTQNHEEASSKGEI